MALPAFLSNHRVATYGFLSTALVSAVILNAFKKQSNFYSAAVYLSRSSGSVLVLSNFGIIIFLFVGKVFQQLFFGNLRPLEIEALYDRLWFFVTESLFAFTIFRDDFDASFIAMFMSLLFLKCFHWVLADRIELMDQIPFPGPDLLFHARANALFGVLSLADLVMFVVSLDSLVVGGMSFMVLFCSEFCILAANLLNSLLKYTIGLLDLRRQGRLGGAEAGRWENKTMYIFYVDLFTDFIKLTTYIAFFVVVMMNYGFPLNVVRDVYVTARAFIGRIRDLIRYRSATKNMDEKYPNATYAELEAMSDKTCIICREEMVVPNPNPTPEQVTGTEPGADATGEATGTNTEQPPAPTPTSPVVAGTNDTPKKLPCGHVFHFQCLRSWLERQQSCPTCRRSVLETNEAQTNAQAAANDGGLLGFNLDGQANVDNQLNNAQRERMARADALLDRLLGRVDANGGRANAAPNLPARQPQPNGAAAPDANPGLPNNGPREFEGFATFGGQWQPWFAPDRNEDEIAGQQSSSTSPAASAASPPQAPSDHSSPASSTSSTQDMPSEASTPAVSAREAAAAAALRRFGGPGSSSSLPSIPAPATSQPRTSAETEPTPLPTPISPEVNFPRSQPSSSRLAPTPTIKSTQRRVPNLIPLFDPSAVASLPAGSTATSSQPTSSFLLPSLQTPAVVGGPFIASPFPSSTGFQPSSSLLPSSLTAEQLTRMDKLTRDAIDERLKVLDNVQSSLWRCTEELTRMRSVLPEQQPATERTPTANVLRLDTGDSSSEKGKQKEDSSSILLDNS